QTATESGKKYPRQTLRRELARTASVLGVSASYDMSAVSMVATRQNFDHAWDMFTDVMLNPTFAPEDLDLERQQVITAPRSEQDNPDDSVQNLENRIVYAGHPYSNDPSGTIANVESFKPADLAAYHKKIMETSRLLLVVVGDIDANDLKPKVAASFGTLPRGN